MRRISMRAITIVLLSACAVHAGTPTVKLRTGTGQAVITNATNATPVRVTANGHGLVDNANVFIEGVVGNTNANGEFYVDVIDANTFELYTASGPATPRAGNGSYYGAHANTQRAGKIAAYTLPEHPRVFVAGPDSLEARRMRCGTGCASILVNGAGGATATLQYVAPAALGVGSKIGVWGSATPSLNNDNITLTGVTRGASTTTLTWTTAAGAGTSTDAVVSEYAHQGNPAWNALVTADNAYTDYQTPLKGVTLSAQAATRYWITGNATALLHARWAITGRPFNAIGGTPACDTSGPYCNGRLVTDYAREALPHLAWIYSVLVATSQLTTGEQNTFGDQMLTDQNNSACTLTPLVAHPGTTLSISGTTVTGTGTTFTSTEVVGGMITADWDGAGGTYDSINFGREITAIIDDTHLTVHASGGSGSGLSWSSARPWQAGDCGFINLLKYHPSSVLTDPSIHQPVGGQTSVGGGTSKFGNLPLSAMHGYLPISMALADNPTHAAKAIRLLQGSTMYSLDMMYGHQMSTDTGMSAMGGNYQAYRSWMSANICAVLSTIPGFPNLGCDMWGNRLSHLLYSWPGTALSAAPRFARIGEGPFPYDGYWWGMTSWNMRLATDALRGYWRQFINDINWTTEMANNQSQGLFAYFHGVDPQVAPVSYSALPTGKLFGASETRTALCLSLGFGGCEPTGRRNDHLIFRKAWTANSLWGDLWNGTTYNDHFGFEHAATLRLLYGNTLFLGADTVYGTTDSSTNTTGPISAGWRDPTTPAMGGEITRSHIATGVNYGMGDHGAIWSTPLARGHLHVVHVGDYVVNFSDMAGADTGHRFYLQYAQNLQGGEGNTTLSGGPTASDVKIISAHASIATLLTRFASPGTLRVALDNPTANSRRVTICTSATGASCDGATASEILVGHRLIAGVADTDLTHVPLNPNTDWTGAEWIKDASDRLITMFSRGGLATRTSMPPVSCGGTCKVFATGFAPGNYDVLVGGTPACLNVPVVANDNSIYCAAVGTGSVTVAAASSAVSIYTASPLANCQTGASCSRVFSATGGAIPYSWSLVAGTLPAGLSLSASGAITGTPTLNETRVFTVRATDSLGVWVEKSFSLTVELTVSIGDLAVRFRLRLRSRLTADTAVVQYGMTSGLGNTESVSCTSGCNVGLLVPSGTLYYRIQFRLSGVGVAPFTSIRSVTIP